MSMNEHAYLDYGIFLEKGICYQVAEKALGSRPKDMDSVQDVLDSIGIVCINNFSGEIFPVSIDGSLKEMDSISCDSALIFYCPLNRVGTLYTAAYDSPNEIAIEARHKIGRYLPDNFDYEKNIVKIIGTLYC